MSTFDSDMSVVFIEIVYILDSRKKSIETRKLISFFLTLSTVNGRYRKRFFEIRSEPFIDKETMKSNLRFVFLFNRNVHIQIILSIEIIDYFDTFAVIWLLIDTLTPDLQLN